MHHVMEAASVTANFIRENVVAYNFLLHFGKHKLKQKYCSGYLLPLILSREFFHLFVWNVNLYYVLYARSSVSVARKATKANVSKAVYSTCTQSMC